MEKIKFYTGTLDNYSKLSSPVKSALYVVNKKISSNIYKSIMHDGVEVGSGVFSGKFLVGSSDTDYIKMQTGNSDDSADATTLELYNTVGGGITLDSGLDGNKATEIRVEKRNNTSVITHTENYSADNGIVHIATHRYRYETKLSNAWDFDIKFQVPGIVIGISNIKYVEHNDILLSNIKFNFNCVDGVSVTEFTVSHQVGSFSGTYWIEFDVCRIYTT